ncbi:peptidylprolyl isomerase [Babesia caballi]|uniref:Peptidyl-prolyl cis-trans isomerase n=1 Tax=Babesia caballi TaxID=5871 RepID=A0AAV4M011_BABCB|nr:peptidylprolyl isomerase [Babesia caballi]
MDEMRRDFSNTKVRCAHILLKHKDSRNPINRNTQTPVTRTKDEAIMQLSRHLDTILDAREKDQEFKRIATQVSECASARNGGDLGYFSRGEMHSAFSNAAFLLRVGDISGLVDTDSGIHLIYRIA